MSRFYLEAIKQLPEFLMDDETKVCEAGRFVFAVNPKYPPMQYTKEKGCWQKCEFIVKPAEEAVRRFGTKFIQVARGWRQD